ncbi:MAG: AMP-binding protein [Muribaculaceae bacterium]|nr:AMP-binding protein [Muribaculaceae bacterium]
MKLTQTTPETEDFLKEWYSDSEYVTAHTSGSTGVPKEIKLLKQDMIASASATNRFFNITESSRLVSPLSASYIAGKMMIVRTVLAGATLEMLTPSNQLNLHGRITLLPIVPSQIESLMTYADSDVKIDNVIVGGAPMTPDMECKLESFPANCYATYGMTETCSHVAIRKVGSPYFRALPGVRFEVDTSSRLLLRLRNFSFDVLQTNDVVELRSHDSFRWLGRFDNVVNSGGVKLFPEEIEQEIAPYIKGEFYLGAMSHAKWGEQLVLCVTPSTVVDSEAMQMAVPHIKLPKKTVILEKFEYTSNGKIKRLIPARFKE